MDEVLVSVVCVTFNQAGTIRDALEGFVAQRAPFRFEVLVHDDASTDGTADIVRDYERRFPERIRGVYQTENQFSKGVFIPREFLWPLIRGRYVALCEGDDFWTDPHKLEKQVAALETRPGVDICAHRALKLTRGKPHGYVAPRLRDTVIPAGKVILGGGNLVATASLLCRTEAYTRWTPLREAYPNDYSLQIQGSLRGGMLYLHDCMSVYRTDTPGSWTQRHGRLMDDAARRREAELLDAADAFTQGRYHRAVKLRKRLSASNALLAARRYGAMLAPRELDVTLLRLSRDGSRCFRQLILSLTER
ncbi:MAG: glycosyltransferase family 2 protein [Bacteroidales bacterium]|nr:glycosyltransferase family 2 protein [Bacteroidales bacterium]